MTIVVAGDSEVIEGGTVGKSFIERTGDTSTPLTVFYAVKGAALADSVYKSSSNEVTILAGATKAKIKIKPTGTSVPQGIYTAKFKLNPSPTSSYLIGSPATAKIKIIYN